MVRVRVREGVREQVRVVRVVRVREGVRVREVGAGAGEEQPPQEPRRQRRV